MLKYIQQTFPRLLNWAHKTIENKIQEIRNCRGLRKMTIKLVIAMVMFYISKAGMVLKLSVNVFW